MSSTFLPRFNIVTLLFFSLIAFACTSKENHSSGPAGSSTSTSRVVNLAIWSSYLSPELITQFEKKTGIKLQISNYSSNEELLAKLEAGASGYDVAVPSDYMVFVMNKLGLLKELDFALLPNSKALDPKFLHKSYDPQNKVSVPYDWGTTGIAVNRTLYQGTIRGWIQLIEIDPQ